MSENSAVTIKIFGLPKKAALLGLVSLLFGSAGIGYRGPLIAWAITPALTAHSKVLDSITTTHNARVIERLDYIEDLIERMPGGRQAATQLQKDNAAKIFNKGR